MVRQKFSDDFNRGAMAQITQRGHVRRYRVVEVSERLAASQHSLCGWKRAFGKAASGETGQNAESRLLKRELAPGHRRACYLKSKPPRISPRMQSKIRV